MEQPNIPNAFFEVYKTIYFDSAEGGAEGGAEGAMYKLEFAQKIDLQTGQPTTPVEIRAHRYKLITKVVIQSITKDGFVPAPSLPQIWDYECTNIFTGCDHHAAYEKATDGFARAIARDFQTATPVG